DFFNCALFEPRFLRDEQAGRHGSAFPAAVLGIAIFRETVILADYLHEQLNGLMLQARVLRARSAFRFRWSVDEKLPDEFVKLDRILYARAVSATRLFPQNFQCIFVSLAGERNQHVDVLHFHVGAIEALAPFLREQPRQVFYDLAHGLARESLSVL